jgi:hypothetical protein
VKTTVEIPDELYQRLRGMLAEQNLTFRSLLERALRRALAEHEAHQPGGGVVRDARYGAGGMTPEFAKGSWEHLRDTIYPGRGT